MSHPRPELALRKQLLLVRAATERAEMAEGLSAARQAATLPKMAVSGLALFKGLPLALSLLERLPLLSPVLSLALSGARKTLLRNVLMAAGAGLLAWKGYQWWMSRNEPSTEEEDEAGAVQD